MVDVHARYIRSLEQAGRLDRALEFLPDDEALAERKAAGQGLTAPELAILLSYTKLGLYDELLASDLPDDPQASPASSSGTSRRGPRAVPRAAREASAAARDRRLAA